MIIYMNHLPNNLRKQISKVIRKYYKTQHKKARKGRKASKILGNKRRIASKNLNLKRQFINFFQLTTIILLKDF